MRSCDSLFQSYYYLSKHSVVSAHLKLFAQNSYIISSQLLCKYLFLIYVQIPYHSIT